MLALTSSPAILAENSTNKLSELINKIKNVKQLLQHHQTEQSHLQTDLKKTEIAINDISLQLINSSNELTMKQRSLQLIMCEQQKIASRITEQQKNLAKLIKASYLLGLNESDAEILLESSDPEKINRLLTYHHALEKQTATALNDLKSNLDRLQTNKETLLSHAAKIKKMQQQQLSQQHQLDSHKHNQEVYLKNIQLQVKNHTEELAQLIKNKQNLEKMIAKLHAKKSYSSDYLTHHTGKFPWPVSGKILERFGSGIAGSELKQNGVLIAAPEGQNVYSVAPGKVIFSNWMPGYGLLMIIDHGKGYMTVYGNNNVLYKKNAEIVGGHELIAKVGHTGGVQKSHLYFGLRYQGKPIDPCVWCGK